MTKAQFDAIVKQAVEHGNKYLEAMDKLGEFVENKYGHHWSDLDCDDIIDSLGMGCGRLSAMTFEDFKESIESRL